MKKFLAVGILFCFFSVSGTVPYVLKQVIENNDLSETKRVYEEVAGGCLPADLRSLTKDAYALACEQEMKWAADKPALLKRTYSWPWFKDAGMALAGVSSLALGALVMYKGVTLLGARPEGLATSLFFAGGTRCALGAFLCWFASRCPEQRDNWLLHTTCAFHIKEYFKQQLAVCSDKKAS